MAKKHSGLSKAAVLAAGVGAAAFAAKKHTDRLAAEGQTLSGEIKEAVAKTAEKTIKMPAPDPSYRNTERGKYEKNSKGIYYTNGNYEAFARPEKPEGVDNKNAYLVGSGLASLAAVRCPAPTSTFWKQWTLQAAHVTVSLIPPEAM